MYIAVYINSFHGDFIPVGPFPYENVAEEWIAENVKEEKQPLWSVFPLLPQSSVPTSPLAQKATGVHPGDIRTHPLEDCPVCTEIGDWASCLDSLEWTAAHRALKEGKDWREELHEDL